MNTQSNSEIEKLLYKLVFQFSIYTLGSNKQLEPYLIQLNKSLKQGVNYQQLVPELISLSKTLAHLSKQEVQKESRHDIPEQHCEYLISRVNELLIKTDIPPKFKKQYKVFQLKIQGASGVQTAKSIIDLGLSLLFKIKEHALSEQKAIENFLTDFSRQFILLGEEAQEVSQSNETVRENSLNLRKIIDSQVDNIKNSSANAEELSSLQQNITQHLQELRFQYQKHQAVEDNQFNESKQQFEEMSQKLQILEAETDLLRNNLKIAHDQALSDALTGLPNRMAYDDMIANEYSRWSRYKAPLALIIWDIDLFKLINDKFGHKAGDKTLALVALLLSKNCRKTDFVARYGGEEFVMLLPNTDSAQAFELAEKIRVMIGTSGFNYQGHSIKLTISCGVSQFSGEDQHGDVFNRADQALYLSKEQGRNKSSIID